MFPTNYFTGSYFAPKFWTPGGGVFIAVPVGDFALQGLGPDLGRTVKPTTFEFSLLKDSPTIPTGTSVSVAVFPFTLEEQIPAVGTSVRATPDVFDFTLNSEDITIHIGFNASPLSKEFSLSPNSPVLRTGASALPATYTFNFDPNIPVFIGQFVGTIRKPRPADLRIKSSNNVIKVRGRTFQQKVRSEVRRVSAKQVELVIPISSRKKTIIVPPDETDDTS